MVIETYYLNLLILILYNLFLFLEDTQQLPLAECLKCKEKVWKICSDSRCKEKTAIFCDFCGKDQNNYNHENHENISYLKLYYWLENYYMDMMNE